VSGGSHINRIWEGKKVSTSVKDGFRSLRYGKEMVIRRSDEEGEASVDGADLPDRSGDFTQCNTLIAVKEYNGTTAFGIGRVDFAVEIYGQLIVIQDFDFDVRVFAVDLVKLSEGNLCFELLLSYKGLLALIKEIKERVKVFALHGDTGRLQDFVNLFIDQGVLCLSRLQTVL
jgi:hypothetical protein